MATEEGGNEPSLAGGSTCTASVPPPLKVYILAGQSNMLDMGMVQSPASRHSGFYQTDDSADEALGLFVSVYEGEYDPSNNYDDMTPKETKVVVYDGIGRIPFPSLPKGTKGTWIARGYIQVKQTAVYELKPGYKGSSYNFSTIDGNEVYRREQPPHDPNRRKGQSMPEPAPTKIPIHLEGGKRYAFSTTFFTQSADSAFWVQRIDTPGSLDVLVKMQGKFPWLLEEPQEAEEVCESDLAEARRLTNKPYKVSKNVWFEDARMCGGWNWDKSDPNKMVLDVGKLKSACRRLTVENGVWVGVSFGFEMGEYHEQEEEADVLLIRSAIGNRALAWDFRPPSSGKLPNIDDDKKKWEGVEYTMMVEGVKKTLENLSDIVPTFQEGQGYEVKGLVWFQGHKDTCNKDWTKAYETNLVNFVKDVRHSFEIPELPIVIGTVGFQGHQMTGTKNAVWEAQMAVGGGGDGSTYDGKHPELGPFITAVDTRDYWRDVAVSPMNQDYHYNRNAETYLLIGQALATGMKKLVGSQ